MELSFILNLVVARWVYISAKTHKIVLKCNSYSMYIKKLSSQAIHSSKAGMNQYLRVNGRVKSVRMEYRCSHRGSWRICLNTSVSLWMPLSWTTENNSIIFYLKVLILFFSVSLYKCNTKPKDAKECKQKVILPLFSPLTF